MTVTNQNIVHEQAIIFEKDSKPFFKEGVNSGALLTVMG